MASTHANRHDFLLALRYSSRNLIRSASLYLLLIVSLAVGMLMPPAQAQSPGTTVPGFWDPKRRVERPPAASVQAIRFVTTDDFPPFNFLNADGRLTGFNVDLARAICDELDIRCTIQAREWDDTLNAVRQGSADAVIAGLAITTAAREELDFSDVYMRWPGRFVVRRDAAAIDLTPDGLKGKTLAVVARTAHEAYLAAFFPEVGRKLYPTPEAAREAVKSGEADAHFGDGMQLSFWLQSEAAEACCVFTGGPYLESRFFGEGLAIAVPRGQDGPQAGDQRRACRAPGEGRLRRTLPALLPGRLLLVRRVRARGTGPGRSARWRHATSGSISSRSRSICRKRSSSCSTWRSAAATSTASA